MGKIIEALDKFKILERKGVGYIVLTNKKSDIIKELEASGFDSLSDLEDEYGLTEKEILKLYWPVSGAGDFKKVKSVPAGAKEKLINAAGLVAGDVAQPELAGFVKGNLAYVDADEYEEETS